MAPAASPAQPLGLADFGIGPAVHRGGTLHRAGHLQVRHCAGLFAQLSSFRDPNGYVIELTASTGTHGEIMALPFRSRTRRSDGGRLRKPIDRYLAELSTTLNGAID